MDVVVALVVVAALVALIIGVVRWTRGGAPYDDGTGAAFIPYVREPDRPSELPRPDETRRHEDEP